MPLRIFLYIARYLRKHANAWRLRELQRRKKQKTQGIKRAKPDDVERLKLPVIIPVVFYTGSAPWTAPRSLIALYDYSELLEPFIPDWVTIYWDLRDQDRQALLDSPAELLQALAVIQRDPSKKPDEQEFETFKNQMLAALKGVVSRQSHLKVQAQEKLLELMFGSLVRNCTNDERKILLSATKTYLQSEDAEKTMTTHLSSDNVYDRFAKAVSDSRKKDVRRGELRMARQILQELLEQRFGQPLKPEILERVQQCKSAVQLRNATLAVSTLTSLEDLRLEKSSPSTA